MIIAHNKGPVAEWRFHGPLVQQLTPASLEFAGGKVAAILSILAGQQLLAPHTARLSRWMRATLGPVAQSERVDKSAIGLRVDEASFLSKVLSFAQAAIDQERAYPLDVEVFGAGTIFFSGGESVIEDLVWLRATTLDTLMISIGTQSDAWLPFTLQGEPQSEICERNAGRLVGALSQIQRVTGFQVEEGVQSDFSVIRGFQIDNIRYADGSVADVS